MINTEEHQLNRDLDKRLTESDFKLGFSKILFHWPLFLSSIIICFLLAFVYLHYTVPVYQINTSVLIKDDKKGGTPGTGDLLNDLDIFGKAKVVDNEIELLQSRTLMREVVTRLNLVVNYVDKARFVNVDSYTTRSVDIVVVNSDSSIRNQLLELTFPNNSRYNLRNVKTGEGIIGNLERLERNKFGTFRIRRNQNFKPKKSIQFYINDLENITDQYLGKLSVALKNKQSTVINLSYVETIPERGMEILNTLTDVYTEAGLADRNLTTQRTIQFIEGRLKLISGELTEVEKDVEGFKSSHGLTTDISSDANIFLESVKENDIKLNEVNLQISVANDIARYVNSNSLHEKLPVLLGINDPVILGQITQLSELQLKRDQLLSTTQVNNPLVAPLLEQIQTTRAGIKTAVNNILTTLHNSKKSLEGNNSHYQASIKKIPSQERQYISIKRQQTLKETLYLYLLQKKEEAALSFASTVSDTRIVDSPFTVKTPLRPKKSLAYLIAFLIGCSLPFIYLFVKDVINDRISEISEITKITHVPFLGSIVYEESKEQIVVDSHSRTAVAEQFRLIRTNLQFIFRKTEQTTRGHVTLFTSSMSGEGKSFVSSNLATVIAISGKKTILLELDLRKPKISDYLKMPNTAGLSNYLIGQALPQEIIKPSGINKNLFIIGSGPIPPNPSELLVGAEIEQLIMYLRENFDEIIIDTAPVGLVTDALILARLADVTVYLLRFKVTFKKQLSQLEELYRSRNFPKLNVIFNGVESSKDNGYGYYSDDAKNNKITLKSVLMNIWRRF